MNQSLSPGLKILWIHLALIYIFPWFLNISFDLSSVSVYQIYPTHSLAIVIIVALCFLLFLFDKRNKNTILNPPRSPPSEKLRFFISFFLLLFGIQGYFAGTNSFRYSSESAFAGTGWFSYLFIFSPIYLKFDLFHRVFFEEDETQSLKSLDFITRVFSLGAYFFTINGVCSALFGGLYFFYILSPKYFRSFLVKSHTKKNQFLKFSLIFFLVFLVSGVGWFLGQIAKTGSAPDVLLSQWGDMTLWKFIFLYLADRISTAYYSFLAPLKDGFFHFDFDTFKNLMIPIYNLVYRLDVLSGGLWGYPKPIIASIYQLNCETLSTVCGEREGTSAGLLGSFYLGFPTPLNLVLLSLFLLYLKKIFNLIVDRMRVAPNLLGLTVIWWTVGSPLDAPLDMLTLLDEGLFSLIILMFFAYGLPQLRNKRKTNKKSKSEVSPGLLAPTH